MKKRTFKKSITILALLSLLSCLLLFTGCTSVKKSQVFCDVGKDVSPSYDSLTDITAFCVPLHIQNNTVYAITHIEIDFAFYNEGQLIHQEKNQYTLYIMTGDIYENDTIVSTDGKADEVKITGYQADFDSFANTHKFWLISTGGLTVLGVLAYVIYKAWNDVSVFKIHHIPAGFVLLSVIVSPITMRFFSPHLLQSFWLYLICNAIGLVLFFGLSVLADLLFKRIK